MALSTLSVDVVLPNVTIVIPKGLDLVCLDPEGEVTHVVRSRAAAWLSEQPVMVCNARRVARRLGLDRIAAYDVLELFAFVRPARNCVPTPAGLARALDLPVPLTDAQNCLTIADAARALLEEAVESRDPAIGPLAAAMHKDGWAWSGPILNALKRTDGDFPAEDLARAVRVWRRLPEWREDGPTPPPGQSPVAPNEARKRLAAMVEGVTEGRSEPRPEQADYTSAATFAFTPRQAEAEPQTVLAEAGTGVGKTLGYLAPATLWAERNQAPVWISTHTRNLQQQVDRTLAGHYRDTPEKVVIRKGRENYLCLLNLEEALRTTAFQPIIPIALGLMTRWAAATRDGDFTGDFPFWLSDLLGRPKTLGLSDRRGECIYSSCDHYRKCFVERSIRRSRTADIVIANHALVMVQAANGGIDDAYRPTRYVFDEGHHLFDTADSAFSANFSGMESSDLRRWLIGAEASNRSRSRGLRRRLSDLLAEYPELDAPLDRVVANANYLPSEGWLTRLAGNAPAGPIEEMLGLIRTQVYARSVTTDNLYTLETPIAPAIDGLVEAATKAGRALAELSGPIAALIKALETVLDREAATLDSETRRKIEATARTLKHRGLNTLLNWQAMMQAVSAGTPEQFVDWLEIDRMEGRDMDIGFSRHWIDPGFPFAESIVGHAHGVLVTSATLTDNGVETEKNWQAAETLSGTRHFPNPAMRAQMMSPFDYAQRTRVFIVKDVGRQNIDQIAAAYRSLFLASQGGALGLFTAIQRLRAVYDRIGGPLAEAGIDLYAQHMDGLNPTTLIDIFRTEENSCLLGTDAIRDGVDIPGRALRLLVFDRVPWSRPSILYKARRQAFGGTEYEDRLTRLRLKQAFGRLIRREDDRGVFVLLDSMLPSRLLSAFPKTVPIVKTGLADTVSAVQDFLAVS